MDPSKKKSLGSRIREFWGTLNKNTHNPELIKSAVEPFFLGADNRRPCSSKETISEITNSRDNGINDWGVEETLHDLVPEQSTSNNQYIEYESSGRRIVDINYVFHQIKNSDHKGPLGCSFLNMTLISEKKHGLRSIFKFKCNVCNIIMFIYSEKSKPENDLPINEAVVSGSISAGIGFSQLSELCATMNIPCMASCTFIMVQNFINKKIYDVAEAQMKIAGEEERRLAIEAGSVDIDGIPMCTVVADGQWSKRSYKTRYAALSGVATIIGYRSRKILFVGIRNRFCVICQRAKNKKLNPPKHTCFLNWKEGATSMEADAVADGFKQSLEMHGLKYNKLIGDGDLNVTKRLNDIMPYGPRLQVIKIECRNHYLLQNDGTKLKALTLNPKYPIGLRNHLKSNMIRLRFTINTAIEKYRSGIHGLTDHQKSFGLRRDIINSCRHIMGDHDDQCEEYYCIRPRPINEKNLMKDAANSGILSDISQIISHLVANVDSLLMNVDNNVCEQFNSIINKQLAGKRIHFSQRNSYNARVEAAVIGRRGTH